MTGAPRSTLFGVATGTPDGGVAIVRISGPAAAEIAVALAGSLPPPRRLARRAIAVQDGHDDGLVVWMPGPASFTGEDVVELHIHAGARNVAAVGQSVLAAGATAAGPGDFSRRAFELGRLSLDEAEGLAAQIAARTDAALAQARRLVAGELGRDVVRIRGGLVALAAEIEANLDFPDDVEAGSTRRFTAELDGFAAEVARWLAGFEAGRRARSRPRVVLAGPANAGKSSLFNALLGRPRALVSATPGTTRDYVEAELALAEYGATLVDTAGLRDSADPTEQAGVRRSQDQIDGADLVLWIEAANAELAPRRSGIRAPVIEVESKRDLGMRRASWVGVALREGERGGLDGLRTAIASWFSADADAPWIGLERHRACAVEAAVALTAARGALADGDRLELVAFELMVAAQRLGEITGRTATGPVGEEVLSEIFARFCIGK